MGLMWRPIMFADDPLQPWALFGWVFMAGLELLLGLSNGKS